MKNLKFINLLIVIFCFSFSGCFTVGHVKYVKPGPEIAQIRGEVMRKCGFIILTSVLDESFAALSAETKSMNWENINITFIPVIDQLNCVYFYKYTKLGEQK
ncbi:hypothetical protein [Leptospira idonii]|uniref:TRL-like family protein n=1 Tax=Leptospira idonii TaxID=1193500 RepID=A0A4R9M2F3_9LEPT|nr:hypothetical protein [Leptospira idonii]TGN20964.1 hypothetical protein EHS15_00120 [Leptospira idonii]